MNKNINFSLKDAIFEISIIRIKLDNLEKMILQTPKENIPLIDCDFVEFNHRIYRCLIEEMNLKTLGDLKNKMESEILNSPYVGKKTIRTIKEELAKYGMQLKEEETSCKK